MEKQKELQLKIFKEFEKLGAEKAATSLTQMLGKKVSVSISEVRFIEIEKIAGTFKEEAEKPMTAIHLQMTRQFSGNILLIFTVAEASRLSDILLKEKKEDIAAPELAQSALKEMGNIITGSYLGCLSETVKKRLLCSPPELVTDMLQAILDGILTHLAFKTPVVAMFEAEFKIENEIVRGYFLLLLEPKNLQEMAEITQEGKNSTHGL